MLRALVWDVDGTIAETERDGHLRAFNQAFADAQLPWTWTASQYANLLRVSGGVERILHFMFESAACRTYNLLQKKQLAAALHERKTAIFVRLVSEGAIGPRPGVLRLIGECEQHGIAMAVATTTSRANIDALFPGLFGRHWRERFAAIVTAQEAPRKKPDPLVYTLALRSLNLQAYSCVAIEDSPQGIQAAKSAGLAVLHTRSEFFLDLALQLHADASCADLESKVCGPRNQDFGQSVNLATLERILEEAKYTRPCNSG
jgi:HAD superfamily hydrolase (TIGR01509 family)